MISTDNVDELDSIYEAKEKRKDDLLKTQKEIARQMKGT